MHIGLFAYSAHPENKFNPGIENLTFNLAQELSNHHTVYVFESEMGCQKSDPSGIEVHRVRPATTFGGFSINQFSFARRVISSKEEIIESLDIVHDIGSYVPLFTRKLDVPVVTTFHHYESPSSIRDYVEMFPEPLILNKESFADMVVAVSPFAADQVKEFCGVNEVTVVPNGVDLEYFMPQQVGDTRPDALELLYVGPLIKRKNITTLLKAIPILDKTSDINISLTIVGKGPLEEHLRLLSTDLGIDQKVTFTGHITDEKLLNEYRKADFFVFPSLLEGFGMVTIEAMACGTPVLTSNISPLNDIVKQGGLFFEPESPSDIASTILRATKKNYSDFSTMARTRAQEFGWNQVAKNYVDVYSDTINKY